MKRHELFPSTQALLAKCDALLDKGRVRLASDVLADARAELARIKESEENDRRGSPR